MTNHPFFNKRNAQQYVASAKDSSHNRRVKYIFIKSHNEILTWQYSNEAGRRPYVSYIVNGQPLVGVCALLKIITMTDLRYSCALCIRCIGNVPRIVLLGYRLQWDLYGSWSRFCDFFRLSRSYSFCMCDGECISKSV